MKRLFLLLFSFLLYTTVSCLPKTEADSDITPLTPWYTGSLLAEGATNAPPGVIYFQTYLFTNFDYGNYQDDLSLHTSPLLFQLNPALFLEIGLLPRLDFEIYLQTFSNCFEGNWHSHIGDTFTLIGFQIATETKTRPAIRFTVAETFPTGQFDQLSSGSRSQVEATGIGSYQTQIQIDFEKQFYPSPLHPLRLRSNIAYTFLSTTTAKGFHIFGGREGGKDRVSPGNAFVALLGMEYSLTQRWVFALDSLFTISGKTSITPLFPKTESSTTLPSSWSLSFAPAIEYNFSSTAGFIGGIWFTAWGKNSNAFASLALSLAFVF